MKRRPAEADSQPISISFHSCLGLYFSCLVLFLFFWLCSRVCVCACRLKTFFNSIFNANLLTREEEEELPSFSQHFFTAFFGLPSRRWFTVILIIQHGVGHRARAFIYIFLNIYLRLFCPSFLSQYIFWFMFIARSLLLLMFTLQRTSRRLFFFLSFKIIIRKDFFFFISSIKFSLSFFVTCFMCVFIRWQSCRWSGSRGHRIKVIQTGQKESRPVQ